MKQNGTSYLQTQMTKFNLYHHVGDAGQRTHTKDSLGATTHIGLHIYLLIGSPLLSMILHRVTGTMSVTKVFEHPQRRRPRAMKAPVGHYTGDPRGSSDAKGPVNGEGSANVGGRWMRASQWCTRVKT
jgi:hypothetical protein